MPSTAFSNRTIRRRRLAGAIRSVLLAAAFAPGFGAASAGDVSSSAVSTDAPTTLARYTIVLRGDALATYRGGVAGYPAAPRIESGRKAGHLDVKAPASRAYVEYLAARQRTFVDALGADLAGHGSHTASTIVGNHWVAPFGGGTFTISGVAPHANIIAYRVCTTGCASTASSQAANQAVIDGADVLNFSISGGVSPWTDTVSVAFRNAVDAGIFVAASAGNDGPVAGSTNHTEPWVETVAASTKDNVVGFRFNLTQPSAPPETQDRPLRPAAPPLPTESLVDVPIVRSPTFDDGSNDGCSPYAADTFTVPDLPAADTIFLDGFDPAVEPGRIPAVAVLALDQNASNCASGARRQAALDAGAIGVIFVDRDFINLGAADTSWSMLRADWDAVWAVIESDPEHARASLLLPAASFPQRGDVVADFSSRGPRANGGQYLVKPDITAPGVDILAAYTAEEGGATSTAMENGTSMSSPHITGSAALLRAVQPDWTPTEVRSAINMTSKIDDLVNADGSATDPFDLGSGRVDLTKAALAGLVLDETTANFVAANPSSGGDLSTLNLASMASADCATTCTFTRTLRSTTLTEESYTLESSGQRVAAVVHDRGGCDRGHHDHGRRQRPSDRMELRRDRADAGRRALAAVAHADRDPSLTGRSGARIWARAGASAKAGEILSRMRRLKERSAEHERGWNRELRRRRFEASLRPAHCTRDPAPA
jgi:hypothetical protein